MAATPQKSPSNVAKGAPNGAAAAAPMWGGEVAERTERPGAGVYGFEITESTLTDPKPGKNAQLLWQITGWGNQNEVDGQKLCRHYQSIVASSPEKQAKLNGLIESYAKALNVKFPSTPSPLQPKIFLGKRAFAQFVEEEYDRPDGSKGVGLKIKRIAKTRAELEK